MAKDFSQAELWVQSYCIEDGVTIARTRRITAAIGDLEKVGKLSKADWFIVWDALGICDERDETSEAIYQFMGLYL